MNISDYSDAFGCGVEAWSKFWGDPLFSGSVMMATYAFAAILAFKTSRRQSGMERAAWMLGAVIMAFQVINTPLDLHGLLWATGRCLAHIQGWYAERHTIQREILVMLAVFSVVIMSLGIFILRRNPVSNGLLVVGVSLCVSMTIVEAIGYHYLETFYKVSLGPLTVPDLFELLGIACVLLAAKLRVTSLNTAD